MKVKCSEVFDNAKADLLYDEVGSVATITEIDKRMVSTVNSIYRDLFFRSGKTGFKPLNSPDDEIELGEDVIYNCLIPGVASKIAFDYGDANQQAYFAEIYNQGLNLLNTQTQISDVLPNVE